MDYNPFSLEEKTILITGASSGIGQATAIECSRMGATVIITGRNNDRLNKTFDALDGKGKEHRQLIADLTKEEELLGLVEQLPLIDGFVNNSGIIELALTQFITNKAIKRVHDINLVAPILLTKNLLKNKKFSKPSSIVFTGSVAGVSRVTIANGIYATAKSGIDAFMKTVALESAGKNIRCNSVNPGMIMTDMIDIGQFSKDQLEQERKKYPLGRLGKPIEVAHAIIFLLSDASSWLTGTALKIDGGLTLS